MKQHIVAAAFLIASTGSAAAYTSYILPETFAPEGDANVQAAFATTFFTPAIALPADLQFYFPDGAEGSFGRVEVTGQATSLVAGFHEHGTYRISTGERLGPVTTLVAADGAWRPLAQGETPPEDAQTTALQTVTVADAYISRGAPTREVVDQAIGAFALVPVTHPNQVLAAQGFEVELRFNGAPFPNMPIVLYESGDADSDLSTFFVTDAQGRASIALPGPGRYVIAARHRGDAPDGAEADVRSYTTTLTFEAITALPAYPPAPSEQTDRRRRRPDGGVGARR